MDERGTIDGGRQAGGPDIAPEDEERLDGAPEEIGAGAGRQVGLGHVIVDHLSTGSPDADDPGGPEDPRRTRDVVGESEQSFPASDPPGFTGTNAADQSRGR